MASLERKKDRKKERKSIQDAQTGMKKKRSKYL